MKFWKITNEFEKHGRIQYHDGLVVDPIEFNSEDFYAPGGIHFSDSENILSFLNNCFGGVACFLREVSLPPDARVVQHLSSSNSCSWKADKVILSPRRTIDVNLLKEFPSKSADMLVWSSWTNNLKEVVDLLLENENLQEYTDLLMFWSAFSNCPEVMSMFIDQSTQASIDAAISIAAHKGHAKICEILLSHGASCENAIKWAQKSGHSEIVEMIQQKENENGSQK